MQGNVINLMWFSGIYAFFFYRTNSEKYKNVPKCTDTGNDSKRRTNFTKKK